MHSTLDQRTTRRTVGRRNGFGLIELTVIVIIVLAIAALLLPSARRSGEVARRRQCKNILKQIAFALRNYHDQYHAFPPAYTVDAEGRPLHSWRTLLLPFLGQKALYDKIDLTKPWDDPANGTVLQTSLEFFRCPSSMSPPNHTTYLAIVATGSCLRPIEGRPLSEVLDGPSNTVLVIEAPAEQSVPWMAPTDADETLFLAINPETNLHHVGAFHVALVDGTVRILNASTSAEIRRALISVAGRDPVEGLW